MIKCKLSKVIKSSINKGINEMDTEKLSLSFFKQKVKVKSIPCANCANNRYPSINLCRSNESTHNRKSEVFKDYKKN